MSERTNDGNMKKKKERSRCVPSKSGDRWEDYIGILPDGQGWIRDSPELDVFQIDIDVEEAGGKRDLQTRQPSSINVSSYANDSGDHFLSYEPHSFSHMT